MTWFKFVRVLALGATASIGVTGMLVSAQPADARIHNGLTPTTGTSKTVSADYRAELEKLAGSQNARDISTVLASGGHIEILVDSETGATLAALKAPRVDAMGSGLSPLGPGCSIASLCMSTASQIFYGFIGTGALAGTWSPINRVTPGDIGGSFDWNGLRNTFAAGVATNLTSPVTITRISRG